MARFTRDFLTFFRELKEHNEKTWFEANRERYEREVKEPFTALVDELLGRVHADGVQLTQTARNAIFRLHRDTRFARDKRPYKTQMAAHLSATGRRGHDAPGFYFAFGPDEAFVGGGAYMVDSAQLTRIRRAIVAHGDELEALLAERGFVMRFGELQGEKNKVLPVEFKPHVAARPLLANKMFFYAARLPPEFVLEADLAEQLLESFRAGWPVSTFFARALASNR